MASSLDMVLKSLRESYQRTLPDKLNQLKELREKHLSDELRQIAHKLKGSGQSFGFPEISEICKRLESAAELEDWAQIASAINDFEQMVNTL
jgi:HPt (histidine-containing phosphotransfer) domain-containing protein